MALATAPKVVTPTPKLALRVVKGKQQHAFWVHLYGVEGIGKTTFAAGAPAPVFIDAEHGTLELDVNRFVFDDAGRTQPQEWKEVRAALTTLETTEHEFKTVVIDTLDAVEGLIWAFICQRDSKANLPDYGFGKGPEVALEEFRILVAHLERIRTKGINVVTLSHHVTKPFKNPIGPDFDRYQLKLDQKAAGLIRERADAVLFANYETDTEADKNTKRLRGKFGTRLIYTEKTGGYDAKNRHDLPPTLPLSWGDFWTAVQSHKPADPARLLKELLEVAPKIEDAALRKQVEEYAEANKGNAAMLAKGLNRAKALIEEKGN